MNSTLNPSRLLPQYIQIKRLARVAFVLTSLAVIPGFFGSLYLLVIAVNELSPKTSTFNPNDWLMFGPLMFAMVGGWWLYYTYWLELQGVNRFGKVSWFVSALVNTILAVYPLSNLKNDSSLLNIISLSWLLTMTIISTWAWLLRLRETV
jgi:hypothetical protein